ncbi:MAG: protein kinase [Acidobacteria bacterium]|nr:protein kinase [Acidobacteriota bacterium]
MSFQIGEVVGDYEVIGVLGTGGMGSVYKVRNTISDRVEAMKVLLPNLRDVAELADRFLREIKVQARLDHPNICALRTAFRTGNQLLMVMELVEGMSLDQILKEGELDVKQAVNYSCQVLEALSYAHSMGVIHRDLKPANMLLTPRGVVKLTDFGIARDRADRKLTRTGVALGSLYYMSPEQILGKEIDGRADVYSLGINLYQALTRQLPFQGDSEYAIMTAQLNHQPRPPVELNPKIPHGLSVIILRALEKDAAKRFQTTEEFRAALMNYEKTMYGMPAASVAAPVRKPARAWWPVAAGLGLVVMGWAGWLSLRWKAADVPTPGTGAAAPAPVSVETPAPRAGPPAKPAVAPKQAPPASQSQAAPPVSVPVASAPVVPVPVAQNVPPQPAQTAPPVATPLVSREPPSSAKDPRQEEWERLSSSRDVAALEAFRRRYPEGPHSAPALRRLEEIEWEAVRGAGDAARLEAYKEKYPSSPHASQAGLEAERLVREASRRLIQEALLRYSQAYEGKDLAAVKAVRPGLSAAQVKSLEDTFRNSRAIQMRLEMLGEPQISGNSATISCRLSQMFTMRNGDRVPASNNVAIQLKRAGGGWVIESMQ